MEELYFSVANSGPAIHDPWKFISVYFIGYILKINHKIYIRKD